MARIQTKNHFFVVFLNFPPLLDSAPEFAYKMLQLNLAIDDNITAFAQLCGLFSHLTSLHLLVRHLSWNPLYQALALLTQLKSLNLSLDFKILKRWFFSSKQKVRIPSLERLSIEILNQDN